MTRVFAVVVFAAGLTACTADLFVQQDQDEANRMVSVLLTEGVAADKVSPDGKTWTVRVPERQVVHALAVLRANGLPREKRVTLGDMFKKEGLLSTPTEERVRFMHGVAQQLESTLSQIDGVITARVHIVLPNNDPLASSVRPSSASVFIKHQPRVDLSPLVVSVKNMVARSVEGLPFENVNVTLVAGAPVVAPAGEGKPDVSLLAIAGAIVATMLCALGWIVLRRPQWLPQSLRKRVSEKPQLEAGPADSEPSARSSAEVVQASR